MDILYTYSITGSFPNQAVDTEELTLQINSSGITSAQLNSISTQDDSCVIDFNNTLSTNDNTTLNNVVASHDGAGLPFLQYYANGSIAYLTSTLAPISNSEKRIVGVTLPPDFFDVGSTIKIEAYGLHTNTTTQSTGSYKVRCGKTSLAGAAICTGSWIYGTTAFTSIPVKVEALLTCYMTGTSGSLIGQMMVNPSFINVAGNQGHLVGTTITASINTYSTQVLELTLNTGASTTSETYQAAYIQLIR